jgi:uncharacterized RDD family membrane protein YckC
MARPAQLSAACHDGAMTDALLPASVGRRGLAFLVDYIPIALWIAVIVGVGVWLRAAAPDLAGRLFADPLTAEAAGFVALTLPVGLYLAFSEAGPRGATIGKRRLGIRVIGADGSVVSIRRSLLRTGLKLAPWELSHAIIWRYANPGSAPEALLTAGLVLVWGLVGANLAAAVLDERRRTIYDRLSRTRVVHA